jgi:DNA-binding SARP family transcriptional activator
MALSVIQLTALPGRLPTQPLLFSHLPGFAIFSVGMLAGALAVLVSGWLRDHQQAGRPRPARLTAAVPAPRIAAGRGRAVPPRAPVLTLVPDRPTQAQESGPGRPDLPAAVRLPDRGLSIGLLGPLTVNGQAGALVPAQSQLIVALALHPAGLQNRRLRVLLGADDAHPKPPDSLRQLIARTRRALGRAADGREWIEYRGHGVYALHPDARVDWREFDALTAEGIAGADTARLTAALEMVRGEPFTQCYYWWLEPALTESVSARIVAAAETLAGLELAADPAAAVRAARIGLNADPSAEQLWRLMMRAEHAAGNLAGVREAMVRCLHVVSEIAADGQPDSATLAVYGQLLAR